MENETKVMLYGTSHLSLGAFNTKVIMLEQ